MFEIWYKFKITTCGGAWVSVTGVRLPSPPLMLNSKLVVIRNDTIDFVFDTVKAKIEGYYNFPPSKNKFIFGKSQKWQWIKMFRELNADFMRYVEGLMQKYEFFRVYIVFALTDEFYKKFEPQNYEETIFDAIFTPYNDNRVVEHLTRKVRFSKNELLVAIMPLSTT